MRNRVGRVVMKVLYAIDWMWKNSAIVLLLLIVILIVHFVFHPFLNLKLLSIDTNSGYNPNAGTKFITYNYKNSHLFSHTFIPREDQAKRKKDVGFILIVNTTNEEVTEKYGTPTLEPDGKWHSPTYGRSKKGTIEIITVKVKDYKTGAIIYTKQFRASPPSSLHYYEKDFKAKVKDSDIEKWVEGFIYSVSKSAR